MKEIVISDSQLKKYVNTPEHKRQNQIFGEKYYQKYGRLPKAKTLETQRDVKVGEIYPEHPNSNVNLKTFYQLYFKNINEVLSELQEKYNIKENTSYVTIDKKYRLRSLFECILYNIFYYEGISNELFYEPSGFLKLCNKKPDFLWEPKKILIEVAGMESESYHKKLRDGKVCLEKLGYKVVILNARNLQKSHKYIEFYKLVCETFGFQIRQDLLDFPSKIVNYKNVDNLYMQDYVDKFINVFSRSAGERDMLRKYLKMMGYEGVKDYKLKKGLGRFEESITVQQVLELFKTGKAKSYDEAAKILKVHKNTIGNKINQAKKMNLIPQNSFLQKQQSFQRRKLEEMPSLEQLKNDLKTLGSLNKVGKKYRVSHGAIKKWIDDYEKNSI